MENEILFDVKTYLGDGVDDSDTSVLLILINRAVRRVCAKRYPWGYTDEQRDEAVSKYRDTVFDAAIYYWVKQGGEFQNSHGENSITRNYQSEEDVYADVVPMVKVL